MYNNILVEQKGGIQLITINRPSQLNALNKETIQELHTALDVANKDAKTGVIILTGSGEKAFVAGADISEFSDFNADEGRELALEGQSKVFDVIENSEKPIIAAMNGFTLGGGLELAMACHIRIALITAKMGLPEVSLGLIPGYGGTQRLSHLVGKGKAMEMILSADMINAEEAFRIGLINHIAEPDQLLQKAEEILKKIMTRSPFAVGCAIRAVNAAFNEGVNGYETEITEFSNCFDSEDFKEGVAAFIQKRKAVFSGK
jgi:enoyl-CoA hydratase